LEVRDDGSEGWSKEPIEHVRGQQVVIKRLLVVLNLDGRGKQQSSEAPSVVVDLDVRWKKPSWCNDV